MRLTFLPKIGSRRTRRTTRPPIRVCFVIDRLSRAGTESQLLALLEHLDRDRVRPSLCLLNEPPDAAPAIADCAVLSLGLQKLANPAAIVAAARLAGFWRQQRVDVVQTYFLDSTYFAAPLARLCGIRHVVRVRNNAGYWLTPAHRRLGRLVGRCCATTVTNSDAGKDSLIASEGIADDRVTVIQNGVDVDRFPIVRLPDTGRDPVRIGAVANLRPVKNIDGLIRAATAVCRSQPEARFEIAGDGEQRLELTRLIEMAGLVNRITLRGSIADIPGFLATLDVAVLCSHSESMSNALLEYMAAGRAIVATNVGSNAQLVRDRKEGLSVPPGDDDALAQAIQELLNDPALARRLGAAARERAVTEFSRSAMVRRFEDFYAFLWNE
jgi:L-malate glycosyltransferase